MNTDDELLSKLKEFYDSAQKQHNISFWASIVAAAVGLLIVIFSVVIFLNNPESKSESVILAVSGVVSEFIGAAFFYIHNKNIDRINSYFSKLVKLQDTKNAIGLVEKMNKQNHDYMYMNIINVLLLRNEQQKELTPELVKALREKPNA